MTQVSPSPNIEFADYRTSGGPTNGYTMAETVTHSQVVFISYSRQGQGPDAVWLKRIVVFLKPLEDRGLITVFTDNKIRAGDEWEEKIRKALDDASVGILLVTADFLASDFIKKKELPRLQERARDGLLELIPVFVSECHVPPEIRRLQGLNDPSVPLDGMETNEANKALVKLVTTIEEICLAEEDRSGTDSGAVPRGRNTERLEHGEGVTPRPGATTRPGGPSIFPTQPSEITLRKRLSH